jgi:hypothetical protein
MFYFRIGINNLIFSTGHLFVLQYTIFRQCSTWYVYIHLDKSLDSDIHM